MARCGINVAEVIDSFDRDAFVKIKGLTQIHLNRPQLVIHKIRIMADSEVDFCRFSSRPRNGRRMKCWAELRAIVSAVGNSHIRGLPQTPCSTIRKSRAASAWRPPPRVSIMLFSAVFWSTCSRLCGLCQATCGPLPEHRSRSHDLRRGPSRYRQDPRAQLRSAASTTPRKVSSLGHIMIALRMVGDKLARIFRASRYRSAI